MIGSDENNPSIVSNGNVQVSSRAGGSEKLMVPNGRNRRALRAINRNIVAEPRTRKEGALKKKNLPIPAHRPITWSFALQLDSKQQSATEEYKKENKSISTPSGPEDCCTIIDVDDFNVSDNSMDVHHFVQHKEAMDEEIDQMDEEVEMENMHEVLIQDIDSRDNTNPLAVAEYVDDIYAYYKKTENASCVPPKYMDLQKDINGRMRAILIDWLIEVHYKFDLMDETLYLTVNLIDRFLAREQVVKKKLQLVGVTAMLIACKYEEVSVPVVEDFIVISDRAYSREEVLQMERLMTNTLQFNLSTPTPYVFMQRFLKAAESNKKLELLSFYIIELCLVEYEMLRFPASLLAAAAIFTAECTLSGYARWSKTCEWYSGYSQDQLLECARLMVNLHQCAGSGRLTGVQRKYSTSKYGYAAESAPALFLLDGRC